MYLLFFIRLYTCRFDVIILSYLIIDDYYHFLARDSMYAIARYMLSPVRLSVNLSVTRVDQSKTVEVRTLQLSPQSSAMTSLFAVNFTAKFQTEYSGGAK